MYKKIKSHSITFAPMKTRMVARTIKVENYRVYVLSVFSGKHLLYSYTDHVPLKKQRKNGKTVWVTVEGR